MALKLKEKATTYFDIFFPILNSNFGSTKHTLYSCIYIGTVLIGYTYFKLLMSFLTV